MQSASKFDRMHGEFTRREMTPMPTVPQDAPMAQLASSASTPAASASTPAAQPQQQQQQQVQRQPSASPRPKAKSKLTPAQQRLMQEIRSRAAKGAAAASGCTTVTWCDECVSSATRHCALLSEAGASRHRRLGLLADSGRRTRKYTLDPGVRINGLNDCALPPAN